MPEMAKNSEPIDDATAEQEFEPTSRNLLRWLVRFVLGILALLGCVALIASRYRHELETIGRTFVDKFGLIGMALGTFIADGFHFPVPPQFYMLLAIASGRSQVMAFLAIMCGSLLGGAVGFLFARRLSRIALVNRFLERSTRSVRHLFDKYRYRAVLIASLTPLAYSVLCYIAGAYRMPKRVLALISLLRIPRLVMFYYLVRLGWAM
jgi:membrane protein YqaA with SNARE-associated domain